MPLISKEIPLPKRFFPDLLPILGDEKYKQVMARYQKYYKNHEFPNNPGLRKHLIEGILPGLALYNTLRESGESQESALAAIDHIFEKLFSDKRAGMQKLASIPFFYNFLRFYIKPAMRQYPAEGWKIDWIQNDTHAIRFNMNSCFYFDILSRYGAPELTASFCQVDDFVYEDMSSKINWQRSKTIASGEAYCDFCFAHKRKLQEKESPIKKNEGFLEISDRYVAYCGNDCTQCPQFKQDCAEGCLGTECANYCETCIVRHCNLARQTANCTECGEYPCQKLEKQFENMANDGYGDWAMAARKVLDEIRHQ